MCGTALTTAGLNPVMTTYIVCNRVAITDHTQTLGRCHIHHLQFDSIKLLFYSGNDI